MLRSNSDVERPPTAGIRHPAGAVQRLWHLYTHSQLSYTHSSPMAGVVHWTAAAPHKLGVHCAPDNSRCPATGCVQKRCGQAATQELLHRQDRSGLGGGRACRCALPGC